MCQQNKALDALTTTLTTLVADLTFAAGQMREKTLADQEQAEDFASYLEYRANQIAIALKVPVEDLGETEILLIRYYRMLNRNGRRTALDVIGSMAGFLEGKHAARREMEADVLAFFNKLPEDAQGAVWDILGVLAGEWSYTD